MILLMLYVCHKDAFTFEVSFSTPTYNARWMYFNFTHILMNMVGSIDLNKSADVLNKDCMTLKNCKGHFGFIHQTR